MIRGLIFLAAFSYAEFAYPCSCATRTIADEYNFTTAIFAGKVVRIDKAEDQLKVEFQVTEIWKGNNASSVTVETRASTAACGFPFTAEKTYLVYATGTDVLLTNVCSRTKRTEEAAEDFRLLDELAGKNRISKTAAPKRDPFSPMKGDRVIAPKSIPKTLNVTNAVVVGITKKEDGYLALIRATNGRVYTMKVGDRLYDGKITRISANTVTFAQHAGSKTYTVTKKLHPFE